MNSSAVVDDERVEGHDPVDVVAVERAHVAPARLEVPVAAVAVAVVARDRLGQEADDRRAQVREGARPGRSRAGRRRRRAGRTRRASRACARRRARRGTRRTASPGSGCRSSSAQARKYVDWPTKARRSRPPGGGVGYGASARLALPLTVPDKGQRVRCRAMSDWEAACDTRREPGASASRTSCATRWSRRSSARPRCGSISAAGTGVAAADGLGRAAPRRAVLVDASAHALEQAARELGAIGATTLQADLATS